MLFKRANGQVNDVDVSKASLVLLRPSVGVDSILSQFTSGGINSMMQWARTQQPAIGFSSLASWPGWQDRPS